MSIILQNILTKHFSCKLSLRKYIISKLNFSQLKTNCLKYFIMRMNFILFSLISIIAYKCIFNGKRLN